MTGAERGFLLLGSSLGDPLRKPLTTVQMRTLALRVRNAEHVTQERELVEEDLLALGYTAVYAQHILQLLSQEFLLRDYLHRAKTAQCLPLTRISDGYPRVLTDRLGAESPAVLWTKGNLELLKGKKIALVGSRETYDANAAFAGEVGKQAALQGYTLVSGNARGADRIAQNACLQHGGRVICVVADSLVQQKPHQRVLYVSEEDFDAPFSAQRAHSRNRVIHALVEKTFVAQCALEKGGTWAGTVKNLRCGWSPVFCYQDDSRAVFQLEHMGAQCISVEELNNLDALSGDFPSFFDQ